jgi:polyisoprenoid-binding protein YceI
MKNLKTIALSLLISVIAINTNAQNKKIDPKTSTIGWIGKKVTGQHNGTINVKDGVLVFQKNKLKGGTITVDMTSINTTDLQAGKGKEDLDGHLKADDFFGTAKYPTAKIDFKLIADNGDGKYTVSADLTIKEITQPIKFDIVVNGKTANTALKINRTKYGIKYGSGSFFENLGDKTISDDFDLNVSLKF